LHNEHQGEGWRTQVATMTGDPLSREWLAHCAAEGQAANTLKRRAAVLRSVGNAGTAARDDLEAWWATRRGLSPATRSNDLACLRAFYRWCQRWEHRTDDPTTRLDAPTVPNNLPHPAARADLEKLRTLPDDLRRAVYLGAYAGLRVSEAAALTWADVNDETRRIYVRGKGAKERAVGLNPILLGELLPRVEGNVVTAGGAPYSADALQRRVNRAIRRVGVDGTFHALRHRFGTMAYAATGDLLAVGRAMGHSSPVTTAIYAETSDEMLDRIAAAVVR